MREFEHHLDIKFGEETPVDYHVKILSLINTGRRDIVQLDTNTISALKKETHQFNNKQTTKIESGAEAQLWEDIRLDICQSFGVPFDTKHIIRDYGNVRGRNVKAFYVLRNQKIREAWYADGYTDHANLSHELFRLAELDVNKIKEDSREFDETYFITKGFLDTDRFKNYPEVRKHLESAIEFQAGKIETPENWFISAFQDSPHELGAVPIQEK
ncbi:MAG: hypothetical protein WC575_02935 [Patescibacteria group bacterium]